MNFKSVIIVLIVVVVLSVVFYCCVREKPRTSDLRLRAIRAALLSYYDEFNTFPPVGENGDGSKIFHDYLVQPIDVKGKIIGPFLAVDATNGLIASDTGRHYFYSVLLNSAGNPSGFVVCDGFAKGSQVEIIPNPKILVIQKVNGGEVEMDYGVIPQMSRSVPATP